MSRSCHSATFSSAAIALPRTSRASPTICSQPIGLRLCGIADEPFWPLANGSSTSPISVFCRPRISSANFSSDAARDRQRRHQLGVPVALDDLRRDRRRLEAEPRADRRFDRRIEMREGADRAGDLADRDRLAGAADALDVALQLARTTAPASGRTSSARRARRACGRSSACAGALRRGVRTTAQQRGESCEDQVARLAHLQRLRGVDDVGGGQAEVQPAAARADVLGDVGREGDQVVLRRSARSRRCARRRSRRARGCRGRLRRGTMPAPRPSLRRRRSRRAATFRSGAGRSRCAPFPGWCSVRSREVQIDPGAATSPSRSGPSTVAASEPFENRSRATRCTSSAVTARCRRASRRA